MVSGGVGAAAGEGVEKAQGMQAGRGLFAFMKKIYGKDLALQPWLLLPWGLWGT